MSCLSADWQTTFLKLPPECLHAWPCTTCGGLLPLTPALMARRIPSNGVSSAQIPCCVIQNSKRSSVIGGLGVTLSEAFHIEIERHKIPVERRVVAALANAPGTLDLYVWLVWRSWSLKEGQVARVPLFGSTGLAQQLGSKEYGRQRDFRQKLGKWLREVKAWWPECPASPSPDGRFLIISSAGSSPAIGASAAV
jgi:hypothetical protein